VTLCKSSITLRQFCIPVSLSPLSLTVPLYSTLSVWHIQISCASLT